MGVPLSHVRSRFEAPNSEFEECLWKLPVVKQSVFHDKQRLNSQVLRVQRAWLVRLDQVLATQPHHQLVLVPPRRSQQERFQ
jgi:hypothetical protein